MPLTIAERKHRMPHGAQKKIAQTEGVSEQYVSSVMNETFVPQTEPARRKVQRVRVRIARALGVTVDEAFPPTDREEAVA